MHMLRITLVLLLATMTAWLSAASRQELKPGHLMATDSATVVKAYTDSLLLWRQRADSATMKLETIAQTPDGHFYRLFAPLTFYHSAAASMLGTASVDKDDKAAMEVDKALMRVYLRRPDLVVNSEKRLEKAGSIRNDITDRRMSQNIDLTQHIGDVPEEVEIVPPLVMVKKPKFWTFSGDGNLQLLQNYVSENWYNSGESNYSMIGSLTLEANYNNKSKLKFENKLEMKLGFQTSRDDTIHTFKTNNDLLRYTGKLGVQATKQWYYSLQVIASTQFAKGLKSNDEKVYSDFMSPFNLSVGIGMEYSVATKNKKLSGSVNISALAFNFVYVDRKNIASSYGVVGDHHTTEDFGSQLTVDLTWTIADQIKWKTRLYGYTTYERVLIEWENTITLTVSKYISTNIFLYPRFDDDGTYDDKFGYWQFKEYCSLGLTYSF